MNGIDVCALFFLWIVPWGIFATAISYSNRQIDGALLILRVKNVKIMECGRDKKWT